MAKKYNIPESDEAKMVEEPSVALRYTAPHGQIGSTHPQECTFDADDAPLQFNVDELIDILKQGEEDIAKGRVYKHEDVQLMMQNKIASWR